MLTLAIAATAGVLLFVLSARLRIPSIALLLPAGVLLGPQGLGWVQPRVLGPVIHEVVGLAVAVILFEGGLALDLAGYRKAPVVIGRMLTVGVAVTWLGTAVALWAALDLPPAVAAVGGSLVVVTGPTVVSPILRRVGVQPKLAHVLYWEGVLIDCVGVFLTVLCFEYATAHEAAGEAVAKFGLRLLVGGALGLLAGLSIDAALRRRWVGPEHSNIFVLATAVLAFGAANAVLTESGILAVVVAGMILAIRQPPHLKQLHHFKLELTELGIGLVFVLLSARLDLAAFNQLGAAGWWVIAGLVLVLRPLNVLIATWGQGFSKREKAFLAWIAPRGIVAASMASLFAMELAQHDPRARILETFTFAVIAVTVLLQGLSAGLVARWLRLKKPPRNRTLITGEPAVADALADTLTALGVPVARVGEGVPATVGEAGARGVSADPLDPDLLSDPLLLDVGRVLALSANPHLNQLVCLQWAEVLGEGACWRWSPAPGAGRLPWPAEHALPDLAGDLRAQRLVIEPLHLATAPELARLGPHLIPLLEVRDGLTHPAPTAPRAPTTLVVLRERIEGLAGLISEVLVVGEPVHHLRDVLDRLLAAVCEGPAERAAMIERILAREADLPTTMGGGVVIPHTHVDGLDAPRCLLAHVPAGIPPDATAPTPDGRPVDLVFLLLSPAPSPTAHLRAMAALARLVYDDRMVQRLRTAPSAEATLRLIRDRE
ncbi:MAG: cation:proton antiporter [Myxococcales bacterium]|nr:cation:proton antiporter [Myxococcales bacterium]